MLNQPGICVVMSNIKGNVGSNSGVILRVEFVYFNNLFTHCYVNFIHTGYCLLLEFVLALASQNILFSLPTWLLPMRDSAPPYVPLYHRPCLQHMSKANVLRTEVNQCDHVYSPFLE